MLAYFAALLFKQGGRLLAVLSAKVSQYWRQPPGRLVQRLRASKAVLNMLLKTVSIEVARAHLQAVLVALHRGTVNSALSALSNGAEVGPLAADAVGDMLRMLDGLQLEQTGRFAYYGGLLPL